MRISFFIGLLAIAGVLTTQADAGDDPVTVLFVPNPPSALIEDGNFNFTYVTDGHGEIMKVPFNSRLHGHKNKLRKFGDPYFTLENGVRFELFTPENPIEPQILQFNNYTSIKKSHFKSSRPTRILIHGWYSEGLLTPRFADAYLVKGKHNVNFIAVNWQKGSDTFNYFTARGRVKDIAQYVAKFVDFLAVKARLKTKDLTIVGHSLGAHISGIAGKKITKGKVAKIVGLDPASPWFKYDEVDERIAKTDATYVEVIHTNAGTLGFSQPLGSSNFYPNGGKKQPGCGWDLVSSCAHRRSYEFYIESISSSGQFYAFQCKSYEELQKGNCSVPIGNEIRQMGGEPGTKKGKGVFYLQTNEKPVFSQGSEAIQLFFQDRGWRPLVVATSENTNDEDLFEESTEINNSQELSR